MGCRRNRTVVYIHQPTVKLDPWYVVLPAVAEPKDDAEASGLRGLDQGGGEEPPIRGGVLSAQPRLLPPAFTGRFLRREGPAPIHLRKTIPKHQTHERAVQTDTE